jgi:sulfhydrogenase subunit delta
LLKLAIVKMTSCSGCINELLSALLEDDIRANYALVYSTELVDSIEFREADLAFVEGSVTTRHQEEALKDLRKQVGFIVATGTCALMGGVQSLRAIGGFKPGSGDSPLEQESNEIYREPKPLDQVVRVDYALPGCPVNANAVKAFLRKYYLGGLPVAIYETVCSECKRRGLPCVLVSEGSPCLGPITVSGCGALCPGFGRGCYGCYGLQFHGLDGGRVLAFAERLRELGLPDLDYKVLISAYSYAKIRDLLGGSH